MSKYKAGDKFVIEIQECVSVPKDSEIKYLIKNIYKAYSEDLLDRLPQVFAETNATCAKMEAYDDGMKESWNIAKKILLSEECGGFSEEEIWDIFGTGNAIEIMEKYSPYKVKERIEAWERKQKETKKVCIGDVVKYEHLEVIVTSIDHKNKRFDGISKNGSAYGAKRIDLWKKTGEHFDLSQILKPADDGGEYETD